MWVSLIFFFFFPLLGYLMFVDTKKPLGFPPGPAWKPIVGCHFEIKSLACKLGFYYLVWEEMRNKYGPIVGLKLGRDRIILVSGQSAVKKVLLKEEFDARPDGFFFRMRSFNKRLGIVFVEGNHFQEQKKFCMMALKKLGMGKKVMEDIIMKEAEELVKSWREQWKQSNVFQMNNVFDIAVLNSLWALMAGERFNLNDKKLSELMNLVHEAFKLTDMSGGVLNQMPFLRFIAPNATGYNKIRFVLNRLEKFLEITVEEHKKNYGREPKDLIDLFLIELHQRQIEGKKSSFTEEQLIVLLLDLFMAGSETTSNNLSMAMLYMVNYPEIQEKVHNTIDSAVSKNRLPTLQDRTRCKLKNEIVLYSLDFTVVADVLVPTWHLNSQEADKRGYFKLHTKQEEVCETLHLPSNTRLAYVEAVLLEVQRHATVVPISVAHRSTRDVNFDGYLIPKDATVLINLRSVLMDKERWGDPENFRPNRFQNSNGQIVQDEWFIPFGLGKRRCLGEGLARSSMFLLFSAVMQNFRLFKCENNFQSMKFQEGITLSPPHFQVILQPKSQNQTFIGHLSL